MTQITTFEDLQQEYHHLTPDALARAVFSMVLEPGDREAGHLITVRGAVVALGDILDGTVETVEGINVRPIRDRVIPRLNPGTVMMALRSAARFGAKLVTPEHPHWPYRVDDLMHSAPVALWTRGNTELLLDEKPIALVGARAATGYGEHVTVELAAGLVDRGHTIVSGAAYGIDGMAHRAALASHGRTVAFLAGGVDRFYPAGHDALLQRIVENGLVASELPLGAAPTKWRFLQRNRLVAAFSKSTVVVEAGWRSGALNTAEHALSVGRPLGAVPGPVTSAASAGCHRLIREYGAVLVTNVEEVAAL